MDNDIITLTDAGHLAAILHAAERKSAVARLAPDGRSALTGTARYIGHLLMTGDRIAADADARDLFLYVRLDSGRDEPWLIRQLIAESPSGRFIADFDTDAFEAAGGQASVPASVAAWGAVYGVTAPVPSSVRSSAQPDNQLGRLTDAIYAITGTDLDTAEGLATEVLWIMGRMIAESACAPLPDFAEGQAVEFRGPPATATWEPGVFVRREGDDAVVDGHGGIRYGTGMDRVRVPAAVSGPPGRRDPADLRSWPLEDLLVLARAAGQLWDSTGRDDQYDVLSDRQRALFDRAAASYLIAEQGGLDAAEYLRLAGDRPFESGDLVEYVSRAWTAQGATRGQRIPGIFVRYTEGPGGKYVIVRGLTAPQHEYQVRRDEICRIDPELISAARSWIADCEWANIGPDDIADLAHIDVIAGIQQHYQGGWAQFTADGARPAQHSEQEG